MRNIRKLIKFIIRIARIQLFLSKEKLTNETIKKIDDSDPNVTCDLLSNVSQIFMDSFMIKNKANTLK